MEPPEATNLPLRDEPAVQDLVDEMVDAYNGALKTRCEREDPSLQSASILAIQREAMLAVVEIVQCQDLLKVRNAGYYRGRDAERRHKRNRFERMLEAVDEVRSYWRDRAKSAEGALWKVLHDLRELEASLWIKRTIAEYEGRGIA